MYIVYIHIVYCQVLFKMVNLKKAEDTEESVFRTLSYAQHLLIK